MGIFRDREEDGQSIVHVVRGTGSLGKLLADAILAYRERTSVIQQQSVEIGLIGSRLETIHGLIFELKGTLETMSSNIDRIEKEAADAAENVGLVRTAVEGLKALVADLTAQVAQGQLDQARLDAAAATLEKADEDIDAIVLPAPTPEPEPTPEPAPEG